MGFLIDTNVLAEIRKGERGNPGVRAWFDAVPEDEIYLSVLTLGKVRHGVELLRRRDPVAAEKLEAWLLNLGQDFSARLAPCHPHHRRLVGHLWRARSRPRH